MVIAAAPLAPALGQQNPMGGVGQPGAAADSERDQGTGPSGEDTARRAPPPDFGALDSVVYHLAPRSRLEVKTGKAGLFGFAGHSHVIRAEGFSGLVVYYPKTPERSHFAITVSADSLRVLTPPDTAEIRKVTEAMRGEVLHVDQHHEIKLVSREVKPTSRGFHVVGDLTLVGETRPVPMELDVELGLDSVRARTSFAVKQTDFGIKPYSGGPAGTVKVADKVTFNIEAVAVRRAPAGAAGAER
ncbi:MAG TPA: YceI family protein [Gemmatimonadales bacterium]|nr:YceI family protein [Gemmatimonadales bacterium]